MTFTVQVDHISLYDAPDEDGIEGTVIYLILSPCPDNPCNHVCKTHPGMTHMYEGQPFALGPHKLRKRATAEEIAQDRANVWGWDGSRAAPTLTPSFLGDRTKAGSGGKYDLDYRIHSFMTGGGLQLCGDSTVVAHPNPAKCLVDA